MDEYIISCQNPRPDIQKLLKEIRPHWNNDDEFQIKCLSGGNVNSMWLCTHAKFPEDKILVRINDPSNILPYVDRHYEQIIIEELSKLQLASQLFCRFGNGMAYEYKEGTVLDSEHLQEDHVRSLVVSKLHKLHQLSHLQPQPWKTDQHYSYMHYLIEDTWTYIQDNQTSLQEMQRLGFPRMDELAAIRDHANELLLKLQERYPLIFCHQDLHHSNIIYDKESDEVHFIDWEVAGYCFAPMEIAKLTYDALKGTSDSESRMQWVKEFLKSHPNRCTPASEDVEAFYRDVLTANVALSAQYVFVIGPIARIMSTLSSQDKDMFSSLLMRWYHSYLSLKKELEDL